MRADELNMSVNVSETYETSAEPDYTGDTEYGDPLVVLGTWCADCRRYWVHPDWRDRVGGCVDKYVGVI